MFHSLCIATTAGFRVRIFSLLTVMIIVLGLIRIYQKSETCKVSVMIAPPIATPQIQLTSFLVLSARRLKALTVSVVIEAGSHACPAHSIRAHANVFVFVFLRLLALLAQSIIVLNEFD